MLDLERKLASAYVGKARSLQIEEKLLENQRKKQQESLLDHEIKILTEKQDQKELEKNRANFEKEIANKKAIIHQLNEHEEKKQAEYEQFLKEKQMIDDIVNKIIQEDEEYFYNLCKEIK